VATLYAPDNCSREQLDELDRLALQWVADYTCPHVTAGLGDRKEGENSSLRVS
jgi:hypothetical protein